MGNLYKLVEIKYGGRCLTCREYIPAGRKVYWSKDIGIWHEDCEKPKKILALEEPPEDTLLE